MTTNEMDRILFNMPISHLQKISHATCNYDCTGLLCKDCPFNYAVSDDCLTGYLVNAIAFVSELRGV